MLCRFNKLDSRSSKLGYNIIYYCFENHSHIFQQILASEVHSALILSQNLVSNSSMNVHNVYNEYYVA